MFRGPATLNVFADDVPAAARWYADLLGVEPYFVRPEEGPPAYVEFRVGDHEFELGIVDRSWAPYAGEGVGGAILHWAVDDLDATIADLLERGAVVHDEKRVRGDGFVTASVVDPFGNVLGVMHNVHYLEMVGRR